MQYKHSAVHCGCLIDSVYYIQCSGIMFEALYLSDLYVNLFLLQICWCTYNMYIQLLTPGTHTPCKWWCCWISSWTQHWARKKLLSLQLITTSDELFKAVSDIDEYFQQEAKETFSVKPNKHLPRKSRTRERLQFHLLTPSLNVQ